MFGHNYLTKVGGQWEAGNDYHRAPPHSAPYTWHGKWEGQSIAKIIGGISDRHSEFIYSDDDDDDYVKDDDHSNDSQGWLCVG